MSIATEKNVVKRRTKGEQTRNQILNAAIEVLATNGIKGTTHRAIANRAELQLSLTTYYFKDIQELVHEAFMLSSNRTVSHAGAAWTQAFELLDNYNKTQLRKVSVRNELAIVLADLATQYLINKISEHSVELAVEQLLFTEIQVSPQLRELAQNHKRFLLTPFIQLCTYFNKENAEIDADIMLTIFTQLEYRNLMLKPDEIDTDNIFNTVKRVINWVLQVK